MAIEDSASVFRWRVLSDQAVRRSQDDSFGTHEVFAQLLYELAQNCATPFAVGLYSGWGTGKTSVVRMLEEKISSDTSRKVGYVYLDVWKYVSDPLKRWMLLETERQLQDEAILPADYMFKGRSLESYLEFEEQWKEESRAKIDPVVAASFVRWFAILTIITGPAAGLLYAYLNQIPPILKFFAPLTAFLATAGLLGIFVQIMTGWLSDYLKAIGFQRITWHVQAKPAFSSEKFGAIFRDMVETASEKVPAKKIVFVFDNLDRCPAPVAIEAIAVVKTYLDEPGCVYVIPCDQAAIVKHVSHSYTGSANGADAQEYAKEFLNKFFQMTLRLPLPVDFDLESFIDKQLEDAGMHDLPPAARDVLVLGYRGETPRQVKRILNDLIGYLALATEAEQGKLLGPGELTSDLPFLTKMSVISANWPEFLDRIAKDPEVWGGIMMALQGGQAIREIVREPGLEEFLARTRYVSPDTDIRPYLFLKRVPYERDALMRTQIEKSLRNGDLAQFQKDLQNPEYAKSHQNMLDMSVNVVRRWRTAGHDVLVRNAAPLMVKAAAAHVGDRGLVNETLDVVEQISSKTSTPNLELLFEPADIFVLLTAASSPQRRRILTAYVPLLDLGSPFTTRRREIFREFLAHSGIVDSIVKQSLSQSLLAQFKAGKGASEYLEMLLSAAEMPAKNVWLANDPALAEIASNIQYSGTEPDSQRIHILLGFQEFLPKQAKFSLMARLAEIAPVSPLGPPAKELQIATEALAQFRVSSLGDVSMAATGLLAQLEGSPAEASAPYTKALLVIYEALNENLRSRFIQAAKETYLDTNDPAGVQAYLVDLGTDELRKILDLPGFDNAVSTEAGLLEAQFKIASAATHRQEHLSCFPALDLVTNLALYDISRPWDLAIYINNVKRALKDGVVDPVVVDGPLAKALEALSEMKPTDSRAVFDAVDNLTEKHPDVTNDDVARRMADRAVEYLASSADEDYRIFRKFLVKLPPQDRATCIRQLENRCFRNVSGDSTKLLGSVTEDVCSDLDVRSNEALVGELFDFAYKAACDHPTAATDSLLRLSEYLGHDDRAIYLDRVLDRLIYLETGDEGLQEMEPFLRVLVNLKNDFGAETQEKLGRFLQRMLSPASEKQRKLRALELLTSLRAPQLVKLVRSELEDMAGQDDVDLATKAAEFGSS